MVTAITMALALVYCVALIVRPPGHWPAWIRESIYTVSNPVYTLVGQLWRLAGVQSPPFTHRHGLYLLLVGVLAPWLVMAVIGRGRPENLGCRKPNRYAWRWLVVLYILSLPFLIWMTGGSKLPASYSQQFDRVGPTAFYTYYTLNMTVEHFFLHGVILALFRRDRRWPEPPLGTTALQDSPFRRTLHWLGLACTTGESVGAKRVTRLIGLPDGCLPAVIGSAALFGVVHLGKDPREMILSFPGGVVLAYLAYRTNTWLTALALHLATAGTAFAIIVATQ